MTVFLHCGNPRCVETNSHGCVRYVQELQACGVTDVVPFCRGENELSNADPTIIYRSLTTIYRSFTMIYRSFTIFYRSLPTIDRSFTIFYRSLTTIYRSFTMIYRSFTIFLRIFYHDLPAVSTIKHLVIFHDYDMIYWCHQSPWLFITPPNETGHDLTMPDETMKLGDLGEGEIRLPESCMEPNIGSGC